MELDKIALVLSNDEKAYHTLQDEIALNLKLQIIRLLSKRALPVSISIANHENCRLICGIFNLNRETFFNVFAESQPLSINDATVAELFAVRNELQ